MRIRSDFSQCCMTRYGTDGADAYWHVISTNYHYTNTRMTTETNFRQISLSKTTPRIWAHMDCAKICAADKKCLAFSFYEKETFYACDLAQDNYCTNITGKALLSYNGSFVWDKINPGMTTGCYKPIPCENIRPGCKGNYPNCTDCIKTCKDCSIRYNYAPKESRTCTLWLEGSGLDSEPLTVLCDGIYTTLFHRKINTTTGESSIDVQLSFKEMGRLLRANTRQYLRFVQKTNSGTFYPANYFAEAIDTNGTITNISFASGYNMLKLSGSVGTLNFVTVANDTYGCGSFWLLDPQNATYCPGGPVRMFGTPVMNGTKLITSGIHLGVVYSQSTFIEAWIYLNPY